MANVYYFPMAFRGLAMNQHRSATGTEVRPRPDTIRVDRFDLSRIQQRDQREALHLLSGGDLGDATLTFRYLSVSGMIKASIPLVGVISLDDTPVKAAATEEKAAPRGRGRAPAAPAAQPAEGAAPKKGRPRRRGGRGKPKTE